ncbi:MAG: C39 family peptidase [Nanoarchaeota archaeon]|nr:C39 family peptidase [Nanoarchaeota archaeon]MBU4241684.1 C39 family peptidase [Nanoarchaeota archaeon]MBU4351709.1 C39 family peptidase [Nanoarchaeota archaeon]MBU4456560.1 C39 family peptidase [Nanoarchaeota archaeon]MCG2719933.1 C39 family peptidase [Nanoarchaeota archaeon]
MILDVPIFGQETDRTCEPSCLKMVFQYYGEYHSESQILKGIGGLTKYNSINDLGTLTIDNALYARRAGFNVNCYSYNMDLLPSSFEGLGKQELKREIEKLVNQSQNKNVLEKYLLAIEEGVNLKLRMPNLNDIKDFIVQQVPVILSVNSRIFFENDADIGIGHSIVATGYSNDYFYCNDPWLSSMKKISSEKLIFALSNNILKGSAYLIAVKPKINIQNS